MENIELDKECIFELIRRGRILATNTKTKQEYNIILSENTIHNHNFKLIPYQISETEKKLIKLMRKNDLDPNDLIEKFNL